MNRKRIYEILPQEIRRLLTNMTLDTDRLQEIRLRVNQPLIILYGEREKFISRENGEHYIVSPEDIEEMMGYISRYSLYAYENEMRQGYMTIEGGHRIGMTGQAINTGGRVRNLKYISSVNVRMAHEIIGCSNEVMAYITQNGNLCHTLIVSPPRCGKTTLLRDIIRQVSDGSRYCKGRTVGVVDERSEIGGCWHGIPQNHLGIRTDVLDGCTKGEGMLLLIRSMSPEVIAVDEIGDREDVRSIEYAMHCGCKMLATAHGESLEELKRRPVFRQMISERRFERYIILGRDTRIGEVKGILNGVGRIFPGFERGGQENADD